MNTFIKVLGSLSGNILDIQNHSVRITETTTPHTCTHICTTFFFFLGQQILRISYGDHQMSSKAYSSIKLSVLKMSHNRTLLFYSTADYHSDPQQSYTLLNTASFWVESNVTSTIGLLIYSLSGQKHGFENNFCFCFQNVCCCLLKLCPLINQQGPEAIYNIMIPSSVLNS